MTDVDAGDGGDVVEPDESDAPSDAGGRPWFKDPRWLGGLAVLILVLIAGGVLLLADDDGDGDSRSAADRGLPTPPPPLGGETDAEGEEFLRLLGAGHELTYHATYTVDGEAVGASMQLDVWRRDGLVRQDMRQTTESGTTETAAFLLADDEVIACQRVHESPWTCAEQSAADEFTAAGMFGNIARELEGADVTATDDEVAGMAARCFSLMSASGEVSQCMSEEGIPLRRGGDGAELVLVDLSRDVSRDVFTPPAEPVTVGE